MIGLQESRTRRARLSGQPSLPDDSRPGHGQLADAPGACGAHGDGCQATPGPGQPQRDRRRIPLPAAFGALVRRHWIFAILAAEAALARVVAMAGFQPAVLFRLDSYDYLQGAVHLSPGVVNVSGYSMFLWLLRPLHSLVLIAGLQHLMGLGVATMVYALLRRYGLPGWGAALAAAPVLLDPAQILAEQLVMADVLAMTLMMAGPPTPRPAPERQPAGIEYPPGPGPRVRIGRNATL